LPPITADPLVALLAEYVRQTGAAVDLLLLGGLALQAYGATDRATQDVDGEIVGELEALVAFLRARDVPADLGEATPTGTARVAEVWVAHYQADKQRIVSNHLTVGEIIEARQSFVIKWACESCQQEVPYPETRAWRFCASCSATIAEAIAAPPQPAK